MAENGTAVWFHGSLGRYKSVFFSISPFYHHKGVARTVCSLYSSEFSLGLFFGILWFMYVLEIPMKQFQFHFPFNDVLERS